MNVSLPLFPMIASGLCRASSFGYLYFAYNLHGKGDFLSATIFVTGGGFMWAAADIFLICAYARRKIL